MCCEERNGSELIGVSHVLLYNLYFFNFRGENVLTYYVCNEDNKTNKYRGKKEENKEDHKYDRP